MVRDDRLSGRLRNLPRAHGGLRQRWGRMGDICTTGGHVSVNTP